MANNLTLLQKAIIIGYAGSFIGEESYNFDSLLNNLMEDVDISLSDFKKNLQDANNILDFHGLNTFAQFKNMTSSDKNLIEHILTKAIQGGVNNNNNKVIMLYKLTLLQFMPNIKTNITIRLDTSVKSITHDAACYLSGLIQNGMIISLNNNATIYKNRIDFGRCNNSDFKDFSGWIAQDFYIEYGNVLCHFNNNVIKHSWLSKQLDYCCIVPSTTPENEGIFNLIYPRFA